MNRFLLVLPLIVALPACGPTGPGPESSSPEAKVIQHAAGKVTDYLPLQEGNSWTYSVTGILQQKGKQQAGGTTKSTMKVTTVKDTPSGRRAEVTLYSQGKVLSSVAFLVNAKGVYQAGAYGTKTKSEYAPPLPMLLLPANPGQKFPYKGNGVLPGVDGTGPLSSEMTYKGESLVDTNAGRMKAIRFDSLQKYSYNGKAFEAGQSAWFVPQIGLVRSIEIVKAPTFVRTIEMKLDSYTVK